MNSYDSIFKEMGESARAASIVLQQLPEKASMRYYVL